MPKINKKLTLNPSFRKKYKKSQLHSANSLKNKTIIFADTKHKNQNNSMKNQKYQHIGMQLTNLKPPQSIQKADQLKKVPQNTKEKINKFSK